MSTKLTNQCTIHLPSLDEIIAEKQGEFFVISISDPKNGGTVVAKVGRIVITPEAFPMILDQHMEHMGRKGEA